MAERLIPGFPDVRISIVRQILEKADDQDGEVLSVLNHVLNCHVELRKAQREQARTPAHGSYGSDSHVPKA